MLYWSTWWKTTKRIHKKSLSSNQICTNLNCMGFLQLWLMNLKSNTSVCPCVCVSVCVKKGACDSLHWEIYICFLYREAKFKQARARTHPHMHRLVFEILQYRGREKQTHPRVRVSPAGRALLLNSCQQFLTCSRLQSLSQRYGTDRHCGFNLSTGGVVRDGEK